MSEAPRRASCVFRAEGRFLFSVATDSVRGEFLIPLGGIVEPNESPEFLGVFEEDFDYGEGIMRGVVFCFLAEAEKIEDFPETAREEGGKEVALEWMSVERLREERRPIFPKKLLGILEPSE